MLTLLLGISVFYNTLDVSRNFTSLVEHDLQVLQNAQKLQKFVVDAETGQRGFIITGDNSFLEPYREGIDGFEHLIVIEKQLVSDKTGWWARPIPDQDSWYQRKGHRKQVRFRLRLFLSSPPVRFTDCWP